MTKTLPPALLERHMAILGKTGSGKSNAAKTFAESLLYAGERVCVIDPTGTWWGMRLGPDGKKASRFKPVIFGGNHADIAIAAEHGAAIAEAIGKSSTSAIIDTRLMKVSERTKFFSVFAETLLSANSGPLHLIIDEAHLFAPQGRVNDPQSGMMLHAANNLVSLGRGIGLRITMISQRPAKLHKDSLTQVETLVAMRLIAPQDRKAIEDWIGEAADPSLGKEIMSSLASLPTGDAWVWSPEIDLLKRHHFPLAATFDSGRPTAHQQALEPLDVSTITTQLEEIRAEVVANDPARLKKRIVELEKQVLRAPKAEADPAELERARGEGRHAGYQEGYLDARNSLSTMFADQAQELADDIRSNAGGAPADIAVPVKSHPAIQHTNPPFSTMKPETRRAVNALADAAVKQLSPAGDTLQPAKRRILAALRDLEAIGQGAPDKLSVAWFADASPKSSAFANNLGALRSQGLIDYPGQGLVALTPSGRDAEPSRAAPTHESIMAIVRGKLAPAQMRLLNVAIEAYPSPVSTAELAAASGASPTSSAFANNRGRLRSLGLIDYPTNGFVRAADLLFPGG